MSGGKIEQKVTLSRQGPLADLAKAIGEGGAVEVALVGPPVAMNLPEEFQCELEIEPTATRSSWRSSSCGRTPALNRRRTRLDRPSRPPLPVADRVGDSFPGPRDHDLLIGGSARAQYRDRR